MTGFQPVVEGSIPSVCSNLESSKMKKYSYIFLKRGLIPEQVAIQAAHAAMTLAQELEVRGIPYYPLELNYVMTPLSISEDDLIPELERAGIDFVDYWDYEYTFVEGKLTQSDSIVCTAIMTYPIEEDNRRWLRMLPLYRIK